MRILKPTYRQRMATVSDRVRAGVSALYSRSSEYFGISGLSGKLALPERFGRIVTRAFTKNLPPLAITQIERPALLVLMVGTTVRQYEEAGQLGRFAASLERHTRYFRTVRLMTTDRSSYTEKMAITGVEHKRILLTPLFGGTLLLLLSVLARFRSIRKTTAVLILDEQAAPAGWLSSRISGSAMSMSVGAPWSPPRNAAVDGWRRWIVRKALNRVKLTVEWPGTEVQPVTPAAETQELPSMVDVDLYCPLTTTDPARPRTIGVFVDPGNEAGARIIMGVAERLKRRRQDVIVRVFVIGDGALDTRAAALQGEARERDVSVEFEPIPLPEMLPDAIARMRMCVAFGRGESVQYLLRAMASGIPAIAIEPEPVLSAAGTDAPDDPDWTYFVLKSSATEQEITSSIETLFREPGVRLRLAREGRRFVVASHSPAALAARETRLLLGPDATSFEIEQIETAFDPQAEAEKLAMMLESVGVVRTDVSSDTEMEEAAA